MLASTTNEPKCVLSGNACKYLFFPMFFVGTSRQVSRRVETRCCGAESLEYVASCRCESLTDGITLVHRRSVGRCSGEPGRLAAMAQRSNDRGVRARGVRA